MLTSGSHTLPAWVGDFEVRLTTEWGGEPADLDPNKGLDEPSTWEGWREKMFLMFRPGVPLNLTGIHVYDEGNPLRPQRRDPWRNVLRWPRQVVTG